MRSYASAVDESLHRRRRRKRVGGRRTLIDSILKTPLSHIDIEYARKLKIKYFSCVLEDALPQNVLLNEARVLNLDGSKGRGTHWVCYIKRGNNVKYFDSFGNLRPFIELMRYLNLVPSINIY